MTKTSITKRAKPKVRKHDKIVDNKKCVNKSVKTKSANDKNFINIKKAKKMCE